MKIIKYILGVALIVGFMGVGGKAMTAAETDPTYFDKKELFYQYVGDTHPILEAVRNEKILVTITIEGDDLKGDIKVKGTIWEFDSLGLVVKVSEKELMFIATKFLKMMSFEIPKF